MSAAATKCMQYLLGCVQYLPGRLDMDKEPSLEGKELILDH